MSESATRKIRSARTAKPTDKPASRTRKPTSAGKGRMSPAKATPTGPKPETIALAKTVSGLRAKGTSWDDIAVSTGKSLSLLASLRKSVRASIEAGDKKFPGVARF